MQIVNGPASSHSGGSWGIHLDGGVAILKMITARGNIPAAARQIVFIFSLVRCVLIRSNVSYTDSRQCVKCFSKGEAVPASMTEWVEQVAQSMDPIDAHSASLVEVISRFIDLHAQIRNSKPIYDCNLIVQESLALDLELDEWEKQLPEKWQFTVKSTTSNSEYIYNGELHEYKDPWILRIYNNYRWARILVNELVIVHQAQSGSFSSDDLLQKQRSLDLITKLATDICTSIYTMFEPPTVWQGKRRAIPHVSNCFLILFPLAVAGSGMGVPQQLHFWAIRILEAIGNQMGISQALAMVSLTRMQRQRWIELYDGYGYQALSEGGFGPRSTDFSLSTSPWASSGRGSFGLP